MSSHHNNAFWWWGELHMTDIGRSLVPTFVVGPDSACVAAVADGLRRCDGVIGFGRPLEVFSEMPGLVDVVANSEVLYSPTRQAEAKEHVLRRWEQIVGAQNGEHGPALGSPQVCEEARAAMPAYLAALPTGRWLGRDLHAVHDATTRFLHALARGHAQWSLAPRVLLDQAPFGLLTSRTLLRILPEARFIHVVREPTDLVRSLASDVWGPIAIDSATTWCEQYVAAANDAMDLLPADRVLQVQWEDLQQVREQSSQTRSDIAAFLGLDPRAISTMQVGGTDAIGDARGVYDWLWMASPSALSTLTALQQAWGYPPIVSAIRPGQRAWLPRTPAADREHHTAS